jgi:hypothetical protein
MKTGDASGRRKANKELFRYLRRLVEQLE